MNKLSSRLQAVANFVSSDAKVIDIGCDHGLLSIYLAEKYENIKIIASDINEKALSSAIKNIKNARLEDRIDIRLGAGLDVVKSDEIDTILLAGMGANTIVGILKYAKDKLINVKDIIIQSNTDLYFLRKNITSIGYYIADEVMIQDKNIIYTIIKFSKGKKWYSYKELYLGPILLSENSELFKKKCDKDEKMLKMILNNIKEGHYLYKFKIKRNIKILEMLEEK